ncbi:MAG: NUDIX hydrolase [Acidimicrobiia bacterium]
MTPVVEVAVGAVALREDAILLVRRGRGPAAGEWSLPGGRVGFGEEMHEALVREVAEETGIEVVVERFLGWVERLGDEPDPYHFVILDFLVSVLDPAQEPAAGDDADEAVWMRLGDLDGLHLVDGVYEFLVDHEILEPAEAVDPGPEPPR